MLRIEEAIDEINKRILQQLQIAGFMVERDAKINCPVRTGNLQHSIHTQMEEEEKACYIGTNVEYAPYVEEGTRYQSAQPYLRPAVEKNREAILNLFKGLI